MALLRIDKILSSQEIASRKEIKMLIKQGKNQKYIEVISYIAFCTDS